MNTPCPACSNEKGHKDEEVSGVLICGKCGARFTTRSISLSATYDVVLPHFYEGESQPADWTHYDLAYVIGSTRGRRHGWFHLGTRRITQTG